jgi:hypothetical protein
MSRHSLTPTDAQLDREVIEYGRCICRASAIEKHSIFIDHSDYASGSLKLMPPLNNISGGS